MTLGAILLGSLATLVAAGVRWSRSLADRAEALEAVRTIWVVIEEEVRPGLAERDWRIDESGALQLRSFQGVGRICESGPSDGWLVAHRGRRRPDPLRDSLLVLGEDGAWRSAPLEASRRGEGCEVLAGEELYHWSWTPSGVRPVLARNFETGSYHLENRAFRYRRGSGGRQPLTPERLSSASNFQQLGNAIQVSVHLSDTSDERPVRSFTWLTRQAVPPQ